MTSLLGRAGFAPVGIHHRLLEHNPVRDVADGRQPRDRAAVLPTQPAQAKRPPSARDLAITVAALAVAPVAVLAELLAGLAGRGRTIAVLARRV